jgi:hypothetical protein
MHVGNSGHSDGISGADTILKFGCITCRDMKTAVAYFLSIRTQPYASLTRIQCLILLQNLSITATANCTVKMSSALHGSVQRTGSSNPVLKDCSGEFNGCLFQFSIQDLCVGIL